MNAAYFRIPKRDILGNLIKVGERAILFSRHGIAYEGVIRQIGGYASLR